MLAPGRCEFKALACALFLRLNGTTWTCTTSIPNLARYAGLDPKTVRRKLAALVEHGGISRRDRFGPNGDQDSPEWTVHRDRIASAVTSASSSEAKRVPPALGGGAVNGSTSVVGGTPVNGRGVGSSTVGGVVPSMVGGVVPSTADEPEKQPDSQPEREPESGFPAPAGSPPPGPTLPKWVPATRLLHGQTRDAALAAVVAAVEALRGSAVNPDRCAGDAGHVLGLWRHLEHPPLQELAAELVQVIGWAQRSPDPLAARDIRAIGWEGGTDRSRAMATICRRDRWADRLDAAQRWTAQGEPTSAPERASAAVPAARPARPPNATESRWAAASNFFGAAQVAKLETIPMETPILLTTRTTP